MDSGSYEDFKFHREFCPRCFGRLEHVNYLDSVGIYLILCKNLRCRWCDILQLYSWQIIYTL